MGASSAASGTEAFRWTAGGGMVGLGDLPGGAFSSRALGTSADGAVVVGESISASGDEAFIWDAVNGMGSLHDRLVAYGLDLTGWQLTKARGISADGLTIVGSGTNPDGFGEAWIACLDCNSNGVNDTLDVAAGTSDDCNTNGVPDECESPADCNTNGVQDICDIAVGTSNDCNTNGVPDVCDIAAATSADCNTNGIPDECDIATGASDDCNTNGIPDDCEPSMLFVDDSATGGLNNGTSWADAYLDLQDALSAADCATNVIRVAQGVYRPSLRTNPADPRSATYQLVNEVSILGGFAGVGAPDPNDHDADTNATILNGDLNADDDSGGDNSENTYHVVLGSGTDNTAVLDGFTITAGATKTTVDFTFDLDANGGGLMVDNGSPTIRNCAFVANAASAVQGRGGAVYIGIGANPEFTNCQFQNNTAEGTGGAIRMEADANPILVDCRFTDNTANGGGAVLIPDGSSPQFSGCTFTSNSSGTDGGALYFVNGGAGTPTLVDCVFTGNIATGVVAGNGHGGAIFLNSGYNISLTGCTLIKNSAMGQGGGMYSLDSGSALTECTFVDNTANNNGGALHLTDSDATVTNCRFIRNGGGGLNNAGGLFIQGGGASSPRINSCIFAANIGKATGASFVQLSSPTFSNCAFVGNLSSGPSGQTGGSAVHSQSQGFPALANCTLAANASALGSALFVHTGSGASASATNCIAWDNTPSQIVGPVSSVTYSNVQGGYAGTGNIGADPADDPLFVGGPSGTWSADATYDPTTGQTTLSGPNAAYTANEHVGKFLNPDTSQNLQTLIINNTATQVVVWGDFSAEGVIGATYQINDYRLGAGSPCIDAADYDAYLNVGGGATDLNGDPRTVDEASIPDTGAGTLTYLDMGAYELQGTTCPGDADGDGDTDISDLGLLLANFGAAVTPGTGGDLDFSGSVDISDLGILLADFGCAP